jgi:hypothetical protein
VVVDADPAGRDAVDILFAEVARNGTRRNKVVMIDEVGSDMVLGPASAREFNAGNRHIVKKSIITR